eukprot:scaffold54828_cov66-Phaeocystis_antarctica.AAC.1
MNLWLSIALALRSRDCLAAFSRDRGLETECGCMRWTKRSTLPTRWSGSTRLVRILPSVAYDLTTP